MFEISVEENRALPSGFAISATRDLTPAGPTPPSPPCEAERDLRNSHETRENSKSEIAAGRRPRGRRVRIVRAVFQKDRSYCERKIKREKESEREGNFSRNFEKIDADKIFIVLSDDPFSLNL